MGVQKTILTSQGPVITGPDKGLPAGKSFAGAVGTLAIGKPGDIVSRAFGPLTYAEVTGAAAEFGAFVAGKGVLVNSNDVPNRSNFEASLTVAAGDTAAFMTYGTFVTTGDKLANIFAGMNARIVYPAGATLDTAVATDAYEVEVTGFKAAAAAQAADPAGDEGGGDGQNADPADDPGDGNGQNADPADDPGDGNGQNG